ncbi:hypothetical protein PI124_g9853 [Phytophthora idaei]|nr:hypothetical protein PI125_g9150 [Phytophthora idaei]KAG3161970.1 hypothetical protein PI126_g6202 [Phytophthora idaei]KAG3245410.1 hypothetical protein PI124_g9853 [Phytophthora idaei]
MYSGAEPNVLEGGHLQPQSSDTAMLAHGAEVSGKTRPETSSGASSTKLT